MDYRRGKTDSELLICQRPIKTGFSINEWTCSKNRLGYKNSLNCLWYKTLSEMSFLSRVVGKNEHAGHFEKGRPEDGLELIRRCWGTMLRKGAETFWEYAWNDADSRWPIPAHAWSSGPTYLLPAYILGIRPQKPGFCEVSIKPQTTGLAWVEGAVPTPAGLIMVKYNKVSSKKYRYAVSIPKGIKSAELILSKSTFVIRKPGRYVFESS